MGPQLLLLSTVSILLLNCGPAQSQLDPMTIGQTVLSLGWTLLNMDDNFLFDKVSIEDQIREVSDKITKLATTLRTSQAKLGEEIKHFINFHDMMTTFRYKEDTVDGVFERFQEIYSNSTHFNTDSLIRFAETCVSDDTDQLISILYTTYRMVKPQHRVDVGLFEMLIQKRESKYDAAQYCGSTTSLQQQVYYLFNKVALCMVKGHVMQLYSYKMLEKYTDKKYGYEIDLVKNSYQRKISDIEGVAWKVMNAASKAIRPCDPKTHIEGKTYTQLKWLFGYVVMSELHLSPDDRCWHKCEDYKDRSIDGRHLARRPADRCDGRIIDCFEESLIHYCPTSSPYRRYNGFLRTMMVFQEDVAARGNASCPWTRDRVHNPIGPLDATPVWYRHEEKKFEEQRLYFARCDDCVCRCDDFDRADTVRTFSTRPVRSNIGENRIITGVKLVERRRMIYIQIQDGKLGPNGMVDNSTVKWQDIDDFDYTNPSIPKDDYFTIKNSDKLLFLSTITGAPGQVLTGVKFARKDGGLTVGIEVTKLNFTSGIVDSHTTTDLFPDRPRAEIDLGARTVPTYTDLQNIANTEDAFLYFRQTDWIEDAGQTPIPFIDIQPIISDPPSPLSGVGMYYKGVDGFGGFIGMKLMSYDYKEFVRRKNSAIEYSNALRENYSTAPDSSPKHFNFCKYLK